MRNLRKEVINYFLDKQDQFDLFIPYDEGAAHSAIASKTNIIKTSNHEKGIFYRVRVPDFIFNQLGLHDYVLKPEEAHEYDTQ